MSAIFPWRGGIIAPPKIIIIKNDEPCDVYFPRPFILKSKMQGHIIEQNKPPLIKAYNATYPLLNNPINIDKIPKQPKILRVMEALSFAKKKPAIWIATKIAYKYKFDTSKPDDLFITNTIPKAMYGTKI